MNLVASKSSRKNISDCSINTVSTIAQAGIDGAKCELGRRLVETLMAAGWTAIQVNLTLELVAGGEIDVEATDD
jgi:hypothetical protein